MTLPKGCVSASQISRGPIKRALVVGINYVGKDKAELRGCHQGAKDFCGLLVDCYGYQSENVKVMLDSAEVEDSMRPRKSNLRRELKALVRDPRSYDTFVFYYAGHTAQVLCKEHTEEDGCDECKYSTLRTDCRHFNSLISPNSVIVAEDADGTEKGQGHGLIKDNDLRDILVDTLPPDPTIKLIGIFDCCHSATLLDLDHGQCNQQRFIQTHSKLHPQRSDSYPGVTSNPMSALSLDQVIDGMSQTEKTEIKTDAMDSYDAPTILSLSTSFRTLGSDSSWSSFSSTGEGVPFRTRPKYALFETVESQDIVERICSSPELVEGYISLCSGFCELDGVTPERTPSVVTFSACTDGQLAYEIGKKSMTQMLVAFLKTNPSPTYGQLMVHMRDEIDAAMRTARKKYRKRQQKSSRDMSYPLPNYQDPQHAAFGHEHEI
ncbi:uncharacterized protein FIBRA_08088 [Fibroporia radiculosa]|uniref:Peptidase C14 caspase domain-containing protein n=1 Tax=Fibroporia radiculosa TaxID=599839 RepID=J4I243_9APHY|nr:uncharacterized protein FIBRA_08088 [Fibroporia radiculosa]CCM05852.1 predicted protein [Fibroporia radiculosa]